MNRKSYSTIAAIALTALGALGAVGVCALALILQTLPGPAAAGPASSMLATSRAEAAPASSTGAESQVERGRYLVQIMVCNDCHTPWKMTPRGPEPDMSRMLSGHPQDLVVSSAPAPAGSPWSWTGSESMTAFAGPWGVSFTANLTPHKETGLGKWTAETFMTALRTGRHEGQGRPILPPMPWPMFRNATDEDLRAIFAYLQSIPPIDNRVPQPLDPPEAQ